jgi:hypothetical protein
LDRIEARLKRDRARLDRAAVTADWELVHAMDRVVTFEFDYFLLKLCGGRLQTTRKGGFECLIDATWHTSTSGWQGAVRNAVYSIRKQRGW